MSVNKNKLYWMHSFISLALMFGFGFLPPIEPITAMGMKVLGAFLGLLYGWMFIELGWPSLLSVYCYLLYYQKVDGRATMAFYYVVFVCRLCYGCSDKFCASYPGFLGDFVQCV